MIRAMRFAIDRERAGAAEPFATIRIERDRFLILADEPLVHDVEHLEKRSVRRNARHFIRDELALRLRIFLPPDFQFEVHGMVAPPFVIASGVEGSRIVFVRREKRNTGSFDFAALRSG